VIRLLSLQGLSLSLNVIPLDLPLLFHPMPSFTKRIPTSAGTLQFYFNRIYTVNGVRFHVSAVDRKNKSHPFLMQEENDAWHIVEDPNIPQWIKDIEGNLNVAIKKLQ
jgi:hypothetical protein